VAYEAVAHAEWRAQVRHQERAAAEVPGHPDRPDEHDGHPAVENSDLGKLQLDD
jgi:hypothetical protein